MGPGVDVDGVNVAYYKMLKGLDEHRRQGNKSVVTESCGPWAFGMGMGRLLHLISV